MSFNEAFGALNIIGRRGMLKCLNLEAMVFEPLTGPTVQFGRVVRLIRWRRGGLLVQSLAEQIGEEMVITVPTTVVVQGDHTQVGAFEIFQGYLTGRGGVAQHGITEG
ncbi:MAG TPA: hypothetical protein VEO53_15320, partial [Candidatus Binatia bacterium]|nr:hypothetical protein [Candidatus Binatia bacterium]